MVLGVKCLLIFTDAATMPSSFFWVLVFKFLSLVIRLKIQVVMVCVLLSYYFLWLPKLIINKTKKNNQRKISLNHDQCYVFLKVLVVCGIMQIRERLVINLKFNKIVMILSTCQLSLKIIYAISIVGKPIIFFSFYFISFNNVMVFFFSQLKLY